MNRTELYEKTARLAVRRGVNVQKDQPLVIRANIRDAAFVRMCVKEAYEAGAKYVEIDWRDEAVTKMDYVSQSLETLGTIPQDLHDREARRHRDGACYLSILSDQPGGMSDVDPAKMKARSSAYGRAMADLSDYTMANRGQWCVIGVPSPAWAELVFPSLPETEAYDRLEKLIFSVSRVDEDTDPIDNWKTHDAELIEHAEKMNAYNFKALHFTSELGTDLTVQLVKDHIWVGGGDTTPQGVYFDPNIPTEEIFCMPHRDHVDGRVYASKPLNYEGKLIENFWFEFKDGKVIDFGAEKGKDTLQRLLDEDEGSRHLGEVALVPYDSPISTSGVLFYETLYDENAACHLALGMPYPENLKGGTDMNREELRKHGANDSLQHEDFMFGTRELSADGITYEGKTVPVFRHGTFVF